ncbi:nucleotide-diphospho-sugar transferase [Meredithblackwellia eburnea MCA 4105]
MSYQLLPTSPTSPTHQHISIAPHRPRPRSPRLRVTVLILGILVVVGIAALGSLKDAHKVAREWSEEAKNVLGEWRGNRRPTMDSTFELDLSPLSPVVANSTFLAASLPKKANATLLILVSPTADFRQLYGSLKNIEDSFNERLGYPYQLLTDGQLPNKQVMRKVDAITKGKASWWLMDDTQGWGKPSWVPKADVEDSIKEIGFNEGYRNMCRFYSGFFWRHPAVAKFDYIWRLDEGIHFWCKLEYDPFLEMQTKNKTIGYTLIRIESTRIVGKGLWDTSREFFNAHPEFVAKGNNLRLVSNDEGDTWNSKIIYNNFEISKRSIWESDAYLSYFNHIDQNGGIYRWRWGDAPIHTIGLAHTIPESEWISFSSTTGYQHGSGKFECPALPQCSCKPKPREKRGLRLGSDLSLA